MDKLFLGKSFSRKKPAHRPAGKKELIAELEKLPYAPGVYFFKDEKGQLLYIGKAGSLKDRVGSYFQGKEFFERPVEWVLEKIARIDFLVTDSVLEAYFLEQELIKKHRPTYNVIGKDDKSFCYVAITQEKFPRVLVVRKTDLKDSSAGKSKNNKKKNSFCYGKWRIKKLYGPYSSRKSLEEALKILRKIFPFHSVAKDSEEKCFDFQLGLCPGPYLDKISFRDYQRNIKGIEMLLRGRKKDWLSDKEKEMKALAKEKEFEKAVLLRNQIFALKKIKDISLIKAEGLRENIFKNNQSEALFSRIEGYDISSLSGGLFVGSMVVFSFSGGTWYPEKASYRKFKIKNQKINNDLEAMEEVLSRRLKRKDWTSPNLIILDGGAGHLNLGKKILDEYELKIPLLAVAKGPTRKKLDLRWWGKEFSVDEKTIVQVRDEAHRFAVAYHRKIRKQRFFDNLQRSGYTENNFSKERNF